MLSRMTLAPILLRKTRTFWQLPGFTKLWLLPTWMLLGFSRALIMVVSFKRLAPRLGIHDGANPWVPLLNDSQELRALEIGRLVRLAACYTPWKSNCFPQAVSARLLLGLYRIPYALYFGLARDLAVGKMQAHAWVAAGRVRVTGGAGFNRFTVVGCFVSRQLADGRAESS